MVGNDVIDLADPEVRSDALHPRFDQRVFDVAEQHMLDESDDAQLLRWVFWAAKEAAYKLCKQEDTSTLFSPSRFRVDLDDTLCGTVTHLGDRIDVEVTVSGDMIHAVATRSDPARAIVTGAKATRDPDVSAAVRKLAVQSMALELGLSEPELDVVRRGRIPSIAVGDERLGLSLSHHGRFVAFACDAGDRA